MIIQQLCRYPIKALNGELLSAAQLAVGSGIVGDRRFAFGIEKSVDDCVWRSSRSYLINAVNDNLLKLKLTTEGQGWRLQSPLGEAVSLAPDDAESLQALNACLPQFLSFVPDVRSPVLIDRKDRAGPKGHWDFPDSELLIINRATIRELENKWGFEIDPKRFRHNILVDGLSAWSEFSLCGSRLSNGKAQIHVLRPARRCAATAVNPQTGDRDVDILNRLVSDYGHGFLGVYAKVSSAGEIVLGQELKQSKAAAVSLEQAVCDSAPDARFWPKAAVATVLGEGAYRLEPVSAWPLVGDTTTGTIKIHHGEGSPITAPIQSVCDGDVEIIVGDDKARTWMAAQASAHLSILISGPFPFRKAR